MIPPKVREDILNDPFYKKCCRENEDCKGRITWEHACYYGGRKIQEKWAIVGLCEYHHGVGKYDNKRGLDKKYGQWVAYNRLFNDEKALEEAKKKYPKAIFHWKSQLLFLNKKYGKFSR